jgi:hypothetical protein
MKFELLSLMVNFSHFCFFEYKNFWGKVGSHAPCPNFTSDVVIAYDLTCISKLWHTSGILIIIIIIIIFV